jgi:hypothetical protein
LNIFYLGMEGMMVITVLEAKVSADKQGLLTSTYESVLKNLDPGIVETFLAADTKDASIWRIITVWENREALDAMRKSGQPPRGVIIFKTIGSDPFLSVLSFKAHRRA